jgi:hypothetical protein
MAAPELKYRTRCLVPGCGQGFAKSPLDVPIIGQPNQQVVEFVSALMRHIQQKHPELMAHISGTVQEVMGFLCVALFQIEDPALINIQERVRSQLHRVTRSKASIISDAQITDRLSRLPIDADLMEPLQGLLQDMRDVLLEEGRYAPQLPEQKPLVTA